MVLICPLRQNGGNYYVIGPINVLTYYFPSFFLEYASLRYRHLGIICCFPSITTLGFIDKSQVFKYRHHHLLNIINPTAINLQEFVFLFLREYVF